jgi:hypothetical protein
MLYSVFEDGGILVSVPELRKEVLGLCDVLQGVLAFNYCCNPDRLQKLDSIRENVPLETARWLRDQRDVLRPSIKEVAREFGLRGNAGKFARWFKEKSKGDLGMLLLPKATIDLTFADYTGKRWADWPTLPPHLLVYLDFTARVVQKNPVWCLPEATLYEDMCVAYNFALERSKLAPVLGLPIGKLETFSVRSSVLCAFYFIEAYLNGIAFDFWVRNRKTIQDADAEALLEWDSKNNREKWLSFRDKLHRYPKIVLGTQHPSLTETNCPEIRLLLSQGKEVRDAIVHLSPKNFGVEGSKLTRFLHLRLHDATEIVDASVSLVRKLNTSLGTNGTKLDWLIGRDATGRFPKEAFL